MSLFKLSLFIQVLFINAFTYIPLFAAEVGISNGVDLSIVKMTEELLSQIEGQRYGYNTKWQKTNKDSLLVIGNYMYLGKKITPVTFENVKKILATIPKIKSEYETTISFQSRLTEVLKGIPKNFVLQVPLDKKYVKYNAEKQLLVIDRYAVDNANIGYEGVFGYGTPFYEKIEYINSSNMDVVISSKESLIGSY